VATSQLPWERLEIGSEHDLRQHMRTICRRLNEAPEVARLLLINPLLVLEDVGVELTPAMREHVMQALRFPKKRQERLAELERQLCQDAEMLGLSLPLPLDGKQRARLVREVVAREVAGCAQGQPGARAVARRPIAAKDVPESLGVRDLRAYRHLHPFLRTLAAYERTRQGALAFFPREAYERFKSGELQHRWVRRIHFKV